jgi:hypothetical protein
MAFVIPTSTTLPHYEIRVDLDGVPYTLEFRWNARDGAWYMHVKNEDDTHLVSGVKVVIGIPLGVRSANAEMPFGVLIALDTSGADEQPGIDELGERVLLYYYSATELFP